jgi:hypothetical protein
MGTLFVAAVVHFGGFVSGGKMDGRWYCPKGWVCREIYDPRPKHSPGAIPRVCFLPKLDCRVNTRRQPNGL